MPSWRAMRPTDLAAAEDLGTRYHINHPERAEIAPNRLALAPQWCFVLGDGADGFCGYCVAHPWGGPLPPGLNMLLPVLPEHPDVVHIHDVVLTESTRGRGLARPLLDVLMDQASAAGFVAATLIAVDGAERYWSRQGFIPDPDARRQAFVDASYGPVSLPMRRPTLTAAAS